MGSGLALRGPTRGGYLQRAVVCWRRDRGGRRRRSEHTLRRRPGGCLRSCGCESVASFAAASVSRCKQRRLCLASARFTRACVGGVDTLIESSAHTLHVNSAVCSFQSFFCAPIRVADLIWLQRNTTMQRPSVVAVRMRLESWSPCSCHWNTEIKVYRIRAIRSHYGSAWVSISDRSLATSRIACSSLQPLIQRATYFPLANKI